MHIIKIQIVKLFPNKLRRKWETLFTTFTFIFRNFHFRDNQQMLNKMLETFFFSSLFLCSL